LEHFRTTTIAGGRRRAHTAHHNMDRDRPLSERDCLDCCALQGMKLQNVTRTESTSIPLLYICGVCGAMFTVPPKHSLVHPSDLIGRQGR
jgi:hypothetical protein